MAFQNIPNPLGGGYSGYLGDLSQGVQALQRTEIQRRLNDIQQQKQWDRDDQLRNEKFALEMMTTDVVNDLRVAHAEKAANDAEEFESYVTKLTEQTQNQGRGFTLKEKMEMLNKQKTILANNAAAKSFIDSVEEGQKLGMQILPKLTDPEMRQSYMDQQAELYSKIKSPEFSWGLGSADVMSAYQPPEPTANVVMGQWTKQLTPLVKEATDVGINGVERINRDKLVNTIAANMQSDKYGVEKVKQRYGLESDQDVYNLMADRLTSSIQQSGGRTTGDGATQDKKNQAVFAASVDNLEGGTSSGVKLRNTSPINLVRDVKSKSGESFRSIDKFTPTQITKYKNGDLYVEGNVSVSKGESRIVTAEDLAVNKYVFGITAADAKKVGTDDNGNDLYEVPAKVSGTVTLYRPYSEFKEELSAIIPNLQNEVAKINGSKSQQPPSVGTFTIQGESYTYDELKGAGWSDEQINQLNK